VRPCAALLLALLAGGADALRAGERIYYRTDENGAIVLTNVPDRKDLRAYPGFEGKGGRRSGERYKDLIHQTAVRHGLHPELIQAVIDVESNFDPNALSNKGAQGLMQLMPATAERFGVSNPYNPADNVDGGTRYLRYLLDLFEGDKRLALAAYNAGENRVLAAGGVPPYRETRNYVARVLQRFGHSRTPYLGR
jgi:soluble lytic murein transglycosylase-like protein